MSINYGDVSHVIRFSIAYNHGSKTVTIGGFKHGCLLAVEASVLAFKSGGKHQFAMDIKSKYGGSRNSATMYSIVNTGNSRADTIGIRLPPQLEKALLRSFRPGNLVFRK